MPLWKQDSGKRKQRIRGKAWQYVEIDGVRKFDVKADGRFLWEFIIQVELPTDGAPRRIQTRLVRWPNTQKADPTAHQSWNAYGLAGGQEHILCAHSIAMQRGMPIGLWVWHDGKNPIVLDGRQIKANAF